MADGPSGAPQRHVNMIATPRRGRAPVARLTRHRPRPPPSLRPFTRASYAVTTPSSTTSEGQGRASGAAHGFGGPHDRRRADRPVPTRAAARHGAAAVRHAAGPLGSAAGGPGRSRDAGADRAPAAVHPPALALGPRRRRGRGGRPGAPRVGARAVDHGERDPPSTRALPAARLLVHGPGYYSDLRPGSRSWSTTRRATRSGRVRWARDHDQLDRLRLGYGYGDACLFAYSVPASSARTPTAWSSGQRNGVVFTPEQADGPRRHDHRELSRAPR